MRLTGAIFDLDGTLLDSMGVWAEVDSRFLRERGIIMPEDYGLTIAPMGFPAAAAYTKERFSLDESEEEIMSVWHKMAVDAYETRINLKPNVKEYLEFLSNKGIGIAAATASMKEYYLPALERCGIREYFSSITEIFEVERGKGFPDVYLRAAEKLTMTPDRCAVFEDIVPGLSGARDGGFFSVGVFDSHNAGQDKIKAASDLYIKDFAWLMKPENDIFK